MTLPNFLIIGATRSGTTSLHYYLQQHPEVFLSPLKSTNFFLFQAQPDLVSDPDTADARQRFPVRTLADYQSLFRGARGEAAIGEVSPEYLARDGVAREIHRHLPDGKVIAILRNPVDRAFAAYLMKASYGHETRPFERVLEVEADRTPDFRTQSYLRGGFYGTHLKRYLDVLGPERVGVFLHDELCTDAPGMLRRMFRFLDVPDDVEVDTTVRFNSWGRPGSGLPRLWQHLIKKRRIVQSLQRRLPPSFSATAARWLAGRASQGVAKPRMSAVARAQLTDIYREDILDLAAILDRDFGHWLQPVSIPQ